MLTFIPGMNKPQATQVSFASTRPQLNALSESLAGSIPRLKPLTKDTVHFGNGPKSSDPDFQRYFDILKDMARQDLQQFKSPGEFEVTEDGKSVKIPGDYIDTPRFMRGGNQGVGQGQGQTGDQAGQVGQDGQPQPGQGPGQPGGPPGPPQPGQPGEEPGEGEEAGEGSGDAKPEDWIPKVSRAEIAQWIGKGLELPNFEPRGSNNIQKTEVMWDTIARTGTPGNIHLRRSFLEAMKRQSAAQGVSFDPRFVQFQKKDFRYQDYTEKPVPKENAVIIYVLDTSGSMSAARKKMARDTNFYLSTYIQYQYGKINAELRREVPKENDFGNGVAEEFIIHDDKAELTSEDKFYTTSKSGGTKFTPAYEQVRELIKTKYPLDKWNVYLFHYTDGDTFGAEDNKAASGILQELFNEGLNMFGYIQTQGQKNGSAFEKEMISTFGDKNRFVRRAHISDESPEEYKNAIHQLLGKDQNSSEMKGIKRK